jgi:hypothetical protein
LVHGHQVDFCGARDAQLDLALGVALCGDVIHVRERTDRGFVAAWAGSDFANICHVAADRSSVVPAQF